MALRARRRGRVERAGGGGDGDAVPHRDLVRGENGSVKEEARVAGSRPRRRDVDPALSTGGCPRGRLRTGGSGRRRSRGLRPSSGLSVRARGGPRRTPRGKGGGACRPRSAARSTRRRHRRPSAGRRPTTPCWRPARRADHRIRAKSRTPSGAYSAHKPSRPWFMAPIFAPQTQQNTLPQCRFSAGTAANPRPRARRR